MARVQTKSEMSPGQTLRAHAAYMFADAWNDSAAKLNPLYWSRSQPVQELASHLVNRHTLTRPLRVQIETDDGQLVKLFNDAKSAAHWLRATFDCNARLAGCSDEAFIDAPWDSWDSAASGEKVAPSAHMDAEQVATAKVTYMWADAGVMMMRLTQIFAQLNPLCWSAAMAPDEVIGQFASDVLRNRPVRLRVEADRHCEQKSFESKDLALQWLRGVFGVIDGDEIQAEHQCVICLDADVSIMLMPCRHAVLCDECAGLVLAGAGQCPICRTQIANHTSGRFADDHVPAPLVEDQHTEPFGAHQGSRIYRLQSIRV